MHFKVPHKTTKTEAKQRITDALEQARPHLQGQVEINKEEWVGDTFHFDANLQGKNVTGTVEVSDMELIFNAKLPLMWRLFEGRIEKEIAKQIATMK